MKCINKLTAILLSASLIITLTGCSKKESNVSYDLFETSYQYNISHSNTVNSSNLFSKELCVTPNENFGLENVDYQVASGGAVFNASTGETLYAQNIYDKLYPASTTKILTAYVAMKHGNLDQIVTISDNACNQASDSSVANLKPGDQLTIRQLLYGLMLRSGNDAAIAIAEGVSGSVDAFVDLMNTEAVALGATNSHFVTPNGLHDEEHYTTVYDMYLIFRAALTYPEFLTMIQTTSYEVYYTLGDGSAASQEWANTCGYLTGKRKAPSGITVLGGKTGTTGQAKYCLVLLSLNSKNEQIISIVFHADAATNLYLLMNEILYQYANN